jgi:hypothetical protein
MNGLSRLRSSHATGRHSRVQSDSTTIRGSSDPVEGRLSRWTAISRAITRDPDACTYTDLALTPVRDDDDMTLDLLTKTTGARAAVAHVNKVKELTGSPGRPPFER